MAYYLRFYFEYHFLPSNRAAWEEQYFETSHWGTALFDFYIPVLEFAPFLVLLLATWAMRKGTSHQPPVEDELN